MSIAQAKRLIGGFKWYHLGFFLLGGCVRGFGSTCRQPGGRLSHLLACQQVTTIIVIVAAALSAGARREFQPHDATVAGVLLAAGSLMYYLAFFGEYSLASVIVSAVVVGFAQGSFFLMWQYFYANEGTSRANVYIPTSAAISVVLCLGVSLLSREWTVLFAVIIFPTLAAWSLSRSLAEVEPYECARLTTKVAKRLIFDTWKPVFCVCAIGIVWRLVSYLSGDVASGAMGVMAGMACAALRGWYGKKSSACCSTPCPAGFPCNCQSGAS